MKEMIKFLKLCKYSFKYKTNLAFLGVFLAIGVINELVTKGTQYLGGFYVVICSIYMFQFIMSLSMSDMIQSSGIGRRIQLDMPVKLNVTLSVVLYTLRVIYRIAMNSLHPELAREIAISLLMIDIMFFELFIYTAFVYKYFIASVVVFCFTFVFVTSGLNIINNLKFLNGVTLGQAIALGYIVIAVGAAIQYLICRMLIRVPISQRAFRGIFKDAK